MTPQTPQLENKALIYKNKNTITRGTAKLFKDHIELYDHKGSLMLNVPVNQIINLIDPKSSWRIDNSFVQFTVNEDSWQLGFKSKAQLLLGGLGGILSVILGQKVGSGPKIAQAWIEAMKQDGISV